MKSANVEASAMPEEAKALGDLDLLFVDCQATAPSLEKGHLLEIGWQRSRAGRLEEVTTYRVALPEGASIPRQITRITGISEADLEGAASLEEVSQALREALNGVDVVIAHWARYEKTFVEAMAPDAAVTWVCTHAVAKHVLPGLPRKGIRAVAGYLGDPMHEVKRAGEHVDATRFIWSRLLERLADEAEIHDLAGLQAFLEEPVEAAPREFPLARDLRLGLPEVPGVYRMLGRDGTVLYVGKATSLKSRVNSYYRGKKGQGSTKLELVTQVHALDVTPTATPVEAALLEADEIKRHAPAYNTVLRRRDRHVFWASEVDLGDTARERSDRYGLGPIASPRMWRHMAELPAVLAGVRPREDAWTAEIDAGVFSEGVRLFAEAYESDLELTQLVQLGEALLAERLGEEPPEEVEDDVKESDTEWTPEGVRELLEWNVIGLFRTLERGAWILRLHDAVVDFAADGATRRLRIHGGHIIDATTLERRTRPQVTSPQSHAGLVPERLSLETYDRLSVLLTELRKLAKAEVPVHLTGAHEEWSPDELCAAFARF